MSFWAAIKYALNSTIGTNEFEPLDEIIRNNKILMASDEEYAVLSTSFNENVQTTTSKPLVNILSKKIKMNNSGSLKIKFSGTIYLIDSYPNAVLNLEIYKNNINLAGFSITSLGGYTRTSNEITFMRGDVIEIKAYVDGTTYPYETYAQYVNGDTKVLGTLKESIFSYI